jgi:DNA anti-recombination protein RmuC
MSNIIEFPEERRIKLKLNTCKNTLKELYDSMQLCYTTIEKLEEKIQEEEHNYDLVFTQYVKARGMDNVEVEYLEWISGDIVINLDTGEISYAGKEQTEGDDPKPGGAA